MHVSTNPKTGLHEFEDTTGKEQGVSTKHFLYKESTFVATFQCVMMLENMSEKLNGSIFLDN